MIIEFRGGSVGAGPKGAQGFLTPAEWRRESAITTPWSRGQQRKLVIRPARSISVLPLRPARHGLNGAIKRTPAPARASWPPK